MLMIRLRMDPTTIRTTAKAITILRRHHHHHHHHPQVNEVISIIISSRLPRPFLCCKMTKTMVVFWGIKNKIRWTSLCYHGNWSWDYKGGSLLHGSVAASLYVRVMEFFYTKPNPPIPTNCSTIQIAHPILLGGCSRVVITSVTL